MSTTWLETFKDEVRFMRREMKEPYGVDNVSSDIGKALGIMQIKQDELDAICEYAANLTDYERRQATGAVVSAYYRWRDSR